MIKMLCHFLLMNKVTLGRSHSLGSFFQTATNFCCTACFNRNGAMDLCFISLGDEMLHMEDMYNTGQCSVHEPVINRNFKKLYHSTFDSSLHAVSCWCSQDFITLNASHPLCTWIMSQILLGGFFFFFFKWVHTELFFYDWERHCWKIRCSVKYPPQQIDYKPYWAPHTVRGPPESYRKSFATCQRHSSPLTLHQERLT